MTVILNVNEDINYIVMLQLIVQFVKDIYFSYNSVLTY
jgi:hypothetical protein